VSIENILTVASGCGLEYEQPVRNRDIKNKIVNKEKNLFKIPLLNLL
jgi:hypothetical protein